MKPISSVLLVTHDLGIVAETCDRVGVMYAGNLCEVADVKDLFNLKCQPYLTIQQVPVTSIEPEFEITTSFLKKHER